jgi:hypothetical protein
MRDQVDRDTTRMLGGSDLASRRSSGLIRAGSLLHDEMRDDDGGRPAAGTFFLLPPSVAPTTGVLQKEEDDFEERALEMEPIKKTLAGSDRTLCSAPLRDLLRISNHSQQKLTPEKPILYVGQLASSEDRIWANRELERLLFYVIWELERLFF